MNSPTPITKLELRKEVIPLSPTIEAIEQKLGRSITSVSRYYLADRPVHNGDTVEIFEAATSTWVSGRFEWSSNIDDLPTFHTNDNEGAKQLTLSQLIRWPP